MFNLFKIEFYKLKKSKMFYFFILLNIMQGVTICFLSVHAFSRSLNIISGKEILIYMLFIQTNLTLNIITGVFAANYIVTEFTSGYIKNLISYGHKRINIFISKTMVYYIGIIIITLITPVAMAVINTVNNGYGEVFTFSSLMFLIRIFLTMILIQVAIGSINVLAAVASKNVNITISVIIALDFANRVFNIMTIEKPSFNWIFDRLIFSQASIIFSDKATVPEFLRAAIVSLITLLVTTTLSIYIFKKSDIK